MSEITPPEPSRRRLPRLRSAATSPGGGSLPPVRPPSTPVIWLLAAGIVLSLGLLVFLIWLTVLAPRPTSDDLLPTPTLTVLTATVDTSAPTAPPNTATPEATETSAAPPPTEAPPTPPPGQVGVGGKVRVVGTGGAGLSLRQQPDPNAPRLAIAAEGEELDVIGGSRQIAGFTWWQVRRADGVEGWAVQNYMQAVTP
jgi:hypothetical protein